MKKNSLERLNVLLYKTESWHLTKDDINFLIEQAIYTYQEAMTSQSYKAKEIHIDIKNKLDLFLEELVKHKIIQKGEQND